MKANDKLKFVLVGFAIVSVLFYSGTFAFAYKNYDSAGTFGDAFGLANAFFSGGALIMIIYAVILQREELAIIKDERDDTRKLLSGQEKINALQEEALRKQIFEQSFSAMLKVVLDEKASLYSVSVIDNSPTTRIEEYSSRARSFLRNATTNSEQAKREKSYNHGAYFLICSLVHLDGLVDSMSDHNQVDSLRQLISSIIDADIAACVAMYVLERRIHGVNSMNFEAVADKYKIRDYLYQSKAYMHSESDLEVYDRLMNFYKKS